MDLLPGGGQGGQLRRQGSLFSGQCLGQRFQRHLRGGLLFLCFGGPLPGLFRPGAQLFPAGRGFPQLRAAFLLSPARRCQLTGPVFPTVGQFRPYLRPPSYFQGGGPVLLLKTELNIRLINLI